MQLIITDTRLTRSRVLRLSWAGLLAALLLVLAMGAALALALRAHVQQAPWAQEVAHVVQAWLGQGPQTDAGADDPALPPDPLAQERAHMRQSVDEMARKVGEMQARLVQLQSLADRVGDMAGVPLPAPAMAPTMVDGQDLEEEAAGEAWLQGFEGGAGGPLVAERSLSEPQLRHILSWVDARMRAQTDFFTVVEDQLFTDFLTRRMIPTQSPMPGRIAGSGFGTRIDPFTGRKAQHLGLDFQAPTGTPILAAAGGIVITEQYHPAYGNMVEIDHGNHLITRYAHASRLLVQRGDVVRRGDTIAEVGSTGRSTGAHLHFEVLMGGQQQNPQRFLDAGKKADWSDLLAQQQ